MKKLLLIFILLISTFAIGQRTTTVNNKLKLKQTPNLSVVDSILTKDSNQILRSTSFLDFQTQLGLSPTPGTYLQNIVEDLTPELGGNLDLNNFTISGVGNINNTGNITTSGTLQSLDAIITNDVQFSNYQNTRVDADAVNFLHTDVVGNLLSSPISTLGPVVYDNYKIIAETFDFTSIPAGYDNAVWSIRYEHDLLSSNITIPSNVILLFEGGSITNYGTITGDNTQIVSEITSSFDGSGRIAGTWNNKEINPIILGAKGDGITDDTIIINDSFTVSKTVKMTSGTYMIDVFNASFNGIEMVSNSNLIMTKDCTLKQIPNASATRVGLIRVDNVQNVNIEGGNLIGDRELHDYTTITSTHEFGHGILTISAEKVKIKNVNIIDFIGDCIEIYGVNNSGIYEPSLYIDIEDCILDSARRNNISVVVGRYINIINNEIKNAGIFKYTKDGTAPKTGVDVEGGSIPSHILIKKNNFHSNVLASLNLFSANITQVESNEFHDGQVLTQSSSNIIITNNQFENSTLNKDSSSRNTLTSGKMLGEFSKYTIVTQSTLDFTTVGAVDNNPGTSFIVTSDFALLGAGDSVLETFENYIISNNIFRGNGIAGGIDVDNVLIDGNEFIEIIDNAISASYNSVKISNNIFKDVTNNAIRITAGDDYVISGNQISNATIFITLTVGINSIQVSNNNLFETGGIILNQLTQSEVTGNIISNTKSGTGQVIYVQKGIVSNNTINMSSPTDAIIRSNGKTIITNNTMNGINCPKAITLYVSEAVAKNNYISFDSPFNRIAVEIRATSSNCIVIGNYITNEGVANIFPVQSPDSNNVVINNVSTKGVFVLGASDTDINNNSI